MIMVRELIMMIVGMMKRLILQKNDLEDDDVEDDEGAR